MRRAAQHLLGWLIFGLALSTEAMDKSTTPRSFSGTWSGALPTKPLPLRLRLYISVDHANVYSVKAISIDQGNFTVTSSETELTENNLISTFRGIGAALTLRVISAEELSGTWSQRDLIYSLSFSRESNEQSVGEAAKPSRHVMEEDVVVHSQGSRLSGTLRLVSNRYPAVVAVLITGSGTQDRDYTAFGHKFFRELAEKLADVGVPSIRMDDRGWAVPEKNIDTMVLARDVIEVVKSLNQDARFVRTRIILMGHSDGASIGALAMDSRIAGLVAINGPMTQGIELILEQNRRELKALSIKDQDHVINNIQAMFRSWQARDSVAKLEERIASISQAMCSTEHFKDTCSALPGMLRAQLTSMEQSRKWFEFFLNDIPSARLAIIKQPVLALFGGKDSQVAADPHVKSLKAALAKNDKNSVEIVVLPEMNHMMQIASTGEITEYQTIKHAIADVLVERIHYWLSKNFPVGDKRLQEE